MPIGLKVRAKLIKSHGSRLNSLQRLGILSLKIATFHKLTCETKYDHLNHHTRVAECKEYKGSEVMKNGVYVFNVN